VSLLFSLTEATTLLVKLEAVCTQYATGCPVVLQNAVSNQIEQAVIVNRRQLREDGGRDLTWCTDQGCYRNNPFQFCTIIGCPRRRENELTGTERMVQSISNECPQLVDAARTEIEAQAAALSASSLANGDACACLFNNVKITCMELVP
jgi:hypothetical protein